MRTSVTCVFAAIALIHAPVPAADGPASQVSTTRAKVQFQAAAVPLEARSWGGVFLKKDVGTRYAALAMVLFEPRAMGFVRGPLYAGEEVLYPPMTPPQTPPAAPDDISSGQSLNEIVEAALKSSGDVKLIAKVRYAGGRVIILADSADEAKQAAQRVLSVLETWWPENGPRLIEAAIVKAKKQLTETEKGIADKKKSLEDIKAFLGALEAGKSTLEQLQVKQLLLEVDVAGVRARIDTAGALLKEMTGDSAADQRRRTELIRTEAQVELAGLLAQKKMLGEMLIAFRKVPKVEADLNRDGLRKAELERIVEMYAGMLKETFKITVPAAVDVAALDWKEPSPPAGFGGGAPYGSDTGQPAMPGGAGGMVPAP